MGDDGGLGTYSTVDWMREQQAAHRRRCEAQRTVGHRALAAGRKRQRQGRKAGRR